MMRLEILFALLLLIPRSLWGEPAGSAAVTIDGETERYLLQTGFGAETSFRSPERAVLVFAAGVWSIGAELRRVRFVVDALRPGLSSTKESASFMFVEEGGRMFSPAEGCSVRIQSSGAGTRRLKGRLPNCRVRSEGFEYLISVEFEVQGFPRRLSE